MKRAWLLLVGLVAGPAMAADGAADRILECMRTNIPQTLRVQEFDLTSVDRGGGERMLRGRLYAMRDKELVRAMVKIKAPPDLNGSAYLLREGKERDDMYVFLPALNKVRRITGGNADGPLFGTDLSYNDIKQVQNAFSGGAVRVEKPETLDGRPVHVLAMTPRADAESRYDLVRGWVDQKTCVALKIEFSEKDVVRKRLLASAQSLKQSGPNWYVSEAEMRDLRENTRTVLRITGVSSGDKLSERYFNSSSFYSGD